MMRFMGVKVTNEQRLWLETQAVARGKKGQGISSVLRIALDDAKRRSEITERLRMLQNNGMKIG